MHKTVKSLFAVVLFVALAAIASAQTFTTLSVAVDAKSPRLTLASSTGLVAPTAPVSASAIGPPVGTAYTVLFVDSEAIRVDVVNGTIAIGARGWQGTRATAHLAGAKVWVGPNNLFRLPSVAKADFAAQGIGAAVASATTVTASNPVFHVTGTTAIATINVPSAFAIAGGEIAIVPDAIFTTTTGGNIGLASTAVVGKLLIMRYEPVAGKWYPSY